MADHETSVPKAATAGEPAVARTPADLALTETQNWASYDHRTLYESVHRDNDPGQAGALAEEWVRLGQEIGEASQVMREGIAATEEGWRGEAATAARGAIRQLADWSESAGQTAGEVGGMVAEQGRIVAHARAAMPEPVEFDWKSMLVSGFAAGGLAGFYAATVDVRRKSDQANAAHEQAVAVMSDMENQSREVDARTPRFTPPPDPVAGESEAQPARRLMPMRSVADTTEPAGVRTDEAIPLMGTVAPTEAASAPTLDAATAGAGAGGQPGMPGLSGGAGTGATAPQFTGAPGGPGSGAMPGLDAYRPSGATGQGGTGAPGFAAPGAGEATARMPRLDAYQPPGATGQGGTGVSGFTGSGPGEATARIPSLDDYKPTGGAGSSGTAGGFGGGVMPNSVMPNSAAFRPNDTTAQGSRGGAGQPNVPPMPDLDSYAPGGTSAQGALGGSGMGPMGGFGGGTGRGGDTVRNGRQTPTVPPLGDPRTTGTPFGTTGGAGADNLRPGQVNPYSPNPVNTGRPVMPPFQPPTSGVGGRPFQPPMSGPGGEPGAPRLGGPGGPGAGGTSGAGGGFGGAGRGFGPTGSGAAAEFGPRGTGSATGAGPMSGRMPAEPVPGGGRGAPGMAGPPAAGMGGMGAAGRGQGGEDEVRKSKYVDGEQIFEVPGADLPPSVIGGGKSAKKPQGNS